MEHAVGQRSVEIYTGEYITNSSVYIYLTQYVIMYMYNMGSYAVDMVVVAFCF